MEILCPDCNEYTLCFNVYALEPGDVGYGYFRDELEWTEQLCDCEMASLLTQDDVYEYAHDQMDRRLYKGAD